MGQKLTTKQELFVQEYIKDWNGRQAAIRAGYSEETAKEMGYENLTKPHIKEAVESAKADLMQRIGMTQERIAQDLLEISQEAREDKQYSPAIRAKELVGKHIGMFEEKLRVSGEVGSYQLNSEDAVKASEALKNRV